MTQPGERWARVLAAGSATLLLHDVDSGRDVELVLPVRETRAWVAALATGHAEAIVPELLESGSRAWVIALIQDDGLDDRTLSAMVNEAISVCSGQRWVTAVRLLGWAAEHWTEFFGWCLARGLPDPLGLRLDAFCALVWHVLFANQDEKGRRKLEWDLTRPPVGSDPDTDEDWAAEEASGFAGAMANLQSVAAGRVR